MSAAHTPGPWLAHNTGERVFTIKATAVNINASAGEKERDYYQGIASVSERGEHPQHGGGIDFKTCKANAFLMASAPDLLELLDQVVKAFDRYDNGDEIELTAALRNKARAVIAKAGGAA